MRDVYFGMLQEVDVIRRRLGWIIAGGVFAGIVAVVVLILVGLYGTRTWEGEMQFTVTSLDPVGRASVQSIPNTAVGNGQPITQDMTSSSVSVPSNVAIGTVLVCHVSQRFTPNTDLDHGPRYELSDCRRGSP